jgi:hypothetical protein
MNKTSILQGKCHIRGQMIRRRCRCPALVVPREVKRIIKVDINEKVEIYVYEVNEKLSLPLKHD